MNFSFTKSPNTQITKYPKPNLIGPHQIDNSGTALAVVALLFETFPVSEEAIKAGLQQIVWPGRMERKTAGRYTDLLPEGWELWFDGGHNPAGALAMAGMIDRWACEDARPLHILLGMKANKDINGVIEILRPRATSLHRIEIGADLTVPLTEIIKAAPSSPPARILICGSFYNYF